LTTLGWLAKWWWMDTAKLRYFDLHLLTHCLVPNGAINIVLELHVCVLIAEIKFLKLSVAGLEK
jgi:hypothetical protein